jgi:serine/threonine protein kinase
VREGRPVDEVLFGRYRLPSLIGAGGIGRVCKAHDTVIGRDVAIKVSHPSGNNPRQETSKACASTLS